MKIIRSLLVLLFCFPLSGCASIRYKTASHIEPVALFDGEVIDLNIKVTFPRSISVPFITHGNIFFGRKGGYEYSFEYQEKTFSRKGEEIWLSLNLYEGKFYLWTTTLHAQSYEKSRFYVYDLKGSDWQEIDRTQFPKSIAVKNLNSRFDREENEMEIARELNPDDRKFRESPTAHLWLILEKGVFLERSHWEVKDIDFLKSFKLEHIKRPVPIPEK